jgi:hypothetical protein
MTLIGQVMSHEPDNSAPRAFVIVDNGSDHRGTKAIRRLRDAHPNAIMIHTPVHASGLNQAEIVFSIVQKKILSPNDFAITWRQGNPLVARSWWPRPLVAAAAGLARDRRGSSCTSCCSPS